MSDYEPGTMARLTLKSGEEVTAFRVSWPSDDWISASEGGVYGVTDVRPLVVLDTEDVEQIKELVQHANFYRPGELITPMVQALQKALRSLASPKPAEPLSLGQIVYDRDREPWVRHASGTWACLKSHPGVDTATWDELVTRYGPVEVAQ